MATYDGLFYDIDPYNVFSRPVGGTPTYAGTQYTTGTATITDNGSGAHHQSLEDNTEGENAIADINVDGVSSSGIDISAEKSWTLLDTVTVETVQLGTFHVGSGANAGDPVFTHADFSGYPERIVEGTAGDDVIDTFIIDPALTGGGPATITAGEGAESADGTLDFNGQLVNGSIVYTNSDDDAGGLSGTATLLGGKIVTFSEIETIICSTAGTLICTPFGPRPVEDLRPGDMVQTRDRGMPPVRGTGARRIQATAMKAPITFAPGSIGNARAISVSPQHRMLIRDPRTQLYFGEKEVLVAAKYLVNGKGVTQGPAGGVTYHHTLFDQHEIVFATGVEP